MLIRIRPINQYRRAESVSQVATTHPVVASKDDVADVWTEQHDKELQFNCGKQLLRLLESWRAGAIKDSELPPEVLALGEAHFKHGESLMKAREAKEKKLREEVDKKVPTDAELQYLLAWVPGELRTRAFDDETTKLAWRSSPTIAGAEVFVLADLVDIPDAVKISAGMSGAWVVQPSSLANKSLGNFLKFNEFIKTRRWMFISSGFRHDHADICAIVEHHATKCPHVKLLPTVDEFALKKASAVKRRSSASVIALIGDAEGAIFDNVQHCMTLQGFIACSCSLDLVRSYTGTA